MTTAWRLVASFGGISLFLLAGEGLVQFFPTLRRRHFPVRLAYAYLLGVVSVSGSLWALSHFMGLPLQRNVIIPVILFLFVAGLVVRFRRHLNADEANQALPSTFPSSGRLAFILATVVIAGFLTCGLFADAVTNAITDFDGQMTWDTAARYVRAERTVDAKILREKKWYINHPQYPLLLPLTQVVIQEVFGTTDDERIPRLPYATFYPVFLILLFDEAKHFTNRSAAALATLTATLVPLFAFEVDGGAAGTFSDFPLACFLGFGLLLLLRKDATPSAGVPAGILLGGAVLTKNEGIPLAIIVFVIAFISAGRKVSRLIRLKRPKFSNPAIAILLAGTVITAALLLLFSWRSGIVNREDENYLAPRSITLAIAATTHRLPLIVKPIFHEMGDSKAWAGFCWISFFVLAAGWRVIRRHMARSLLAAIVGAISVYLIAYGITPWPPEVLVHPTWNRFLTQLAVPYFVLFAMALQQILRNCKISLSMIPDITKEHISTNV